MRFGWNTEAAGLAGELIQLHHQHLLGADIKHVFREEASTKGGRTTMATTSKVGGANAMLVAEEEDTSWDDEGVWYEGEFFLVTYAYDVWCGIDDVQKYALVDHELCHIALGRKGLQLVTHDVEEFNAVLKRYGLWKADVREFIEIGRGIQKLDLITGESQE